MRRLCPIYHVSVWLVCIQDKLDTYKASSEFDSAHGTSMSEVLLTLAAMRAELAAIREENIELRSMIFRRLATDEH